MSGRSPRRPIPRRHCSLVVLCASSLLIGAGGSSRSSNLLLGQVEATVDGHRVVVVDHGNFLINDRPAFARGRLT